MGISQNIRKTLNMKPDLSFGFYLTDFLFRKVLRQNSGVTWPVHHSSVIHSPERIKRGKNVFPGDSPGNYINASAGIEIGDYSNIGPNVGLISANHDTVDNSRHTDVGPLKIGRFCWIGMNAVILPGVQLGDFTIVAAGAIVTDSFPDGYCIIGGNPAKVIKQQNKEECDAFAKTKE